MNFAQRPQIINWYVGIIGQDGEETNYEGDRLLWSPSLKDKDRIYGYTREPAKASAELIILGIALYELETKGDTFGLKWSEATLENPFIVPNGERFSFEYIVGWNS